MQGHLPFPAHHDRHRARRPGLRDRLARLLRTLGNWRSLRRQRAHLAELDDHILRDIGLTRDDALREAQRPVWDAPERWRR